MKNFFVGNHRKLPEIGQQTEHAVTLLDRTERQLFDYQVMTADLVVGQEADEARFGGMQMVDPYRRVNENHRQTLSAEVQPMPANPSHRELPGDGRSPPG